MENPNEFKEKSTKFSASDIDEVRQENAAYQYLCHLEEARLWIQECIQETLPRATEFETRLRNGVYLAKVGNFIAPHIVPIRKIFDKDQTLYDTSGLHYRHTDNINYWIQAMKAVGLPVYFYPNSFDVYGKKNMPKAVYCLHALSLYLHRCGRGMKVIDLMGKIQFSSEEIDSVCKEFKQFGIQLPPFSKINRILTEEISPSDATLHAAIIAINIAISHQNCEHLFSALMNPNAKLKNVFRENSESYQRNLFVKKTKYFEFKPKNMSTNKQWLQWDFLTHDVIQEEIDSVNVTSLLIELKNSALCHYATRFMSTLQDSLLNISDVILDNLNAYIAGYKELYKRCENDFLDQADVQILVNNVNYNEYKSQETKSVLTILNNTLIGNDYLTSFNILKSLITDIELNDFGRQFYHIQLKKLKTKKGDFINILDLQENLPIFNALLDVSIAVIQNNVDDTFKALSNPVIKNWDLDQNLKQEYFRILSEFNCKHDINFLSIEEIKNYIADINTVYKLEKISVISTKNINSAIDSKDVNLVIKSLLEDPCMLSVYLNHKELYLILLVECKTNKFNTDLSRDEIQTQINTANKLVLEAEYFCASITSVNIAVDKKDSNMLFDSLSVLCKDEELCKNCKDYYLSELSAVKQIKYDNCLLAKDISLYSWVKCILSSQITYHLNLTTLETSWNRKDDQLSLLLDKNEIIDAIYKVQKECKCYVYEKCKNFIVDFQAHIRGFLVRKMLEKSKKSSVVYTDTHAKAALKLQSFIRMSLVRRKFLNKRVEKLKFDSAARIIQKSWRAFKINQNLNLLAHSSRPAIPLIQRIIYMLEISNDDYSEEFKLHTVKSKVVKTIRYNQDLAKEVDEMDVKIGLLIRNRITLEDFLVQKKKANVKNKVENENQLFNIKNRNFRLFSKKYKCLIESYEHLLYLLQTKPKYLSTLLVLLPCNQITPLIESVIFSLYNFGSTLREEYLLLKMIRLTLKKEIEQKGDNLSDILKDESIFMKIIISFYRKNYWHDYLKKLLEPLISEVLKDETTSFCLDPVEIYKVWQNEIEMETGEKSSLPHEITIDEALNYPEVNYRLNISLDSLLKYSLKFCQAILNAEKFIPYGIMYICKFLKQTLKTKYPLSSEKELNKIIGNFLYYRYINPAIIAPDLFNIIDTSYNEPLTSCERLKLSAVAKFLHSSVMGKKYTEENCHLMCLNPYLSDCHTNFMLFLEDICKIKELEEQFNIDIFSEALMQISEVYTTFNELESLLKLLIEKEYDLAPDPDDVLHEVLQEFNPGTFESIGESSDDFLKTEICLSLRNKYELEVDDETDEEKLYAETKFMIINLLQLFSNVENINELVQREPTAEEELKFENICFSEKKERDFSRNWIKRCQNWKTLESLQLGLEFNLHSLEQAGLVHSSNNYQDILNDIAKDIVNRWRYRISRKQDIFKLLEIQKQLDKKTVFYLEKLDCYNKYIAVCLENMKIGKKHAQRFFHQKRKIDELKNKKTIKCSGNKLYEKGIIVEIKDLDVSQFKSVQFEISPADLGIFVVKTKFKCIPLETFEIDIQDLLSMQYQGIAEMKMFDSVKVNNNLLLHFLNSKFYGKCKS